MFLFASFDSIHISVATVIYNLQPFFLLLLCAIFLRQNVQWSTWGWMLMAFVGVFLAAEVSFSGASFEALQGMGLALGAAFFYALATIFTRQAPGVSPAAMAAAQLGFCLPLLGAWLLWNGADWSQVDWKYVGLLGGLNSIAQYVLLYFAISHLTLERLSILSFLYPITTLLVDMLFYDMELSAAQTVGIALILLANTAILRRKPQPDKGARAGSPTGRQAIAE
nr:DMT family transporter [Hahella chejuensis]